MSLTNIKNDVKIMPNAIVCEDSNIKGDVTISSHTVIHPSATIIAESGPIIIGEYCIVEEYAKIIHHIPADHPKYDPNVTPVLVIGSNNMFEVGSVVEAQQIGDKNVFECKSYVSNSVTVSNGCVIGAGCQVTGEQELAENTVIYGNECYQREALEKQGSQILQVEYLKKILPNYHRLRKPMHDPKKSRADV